MKPICFAVIALALVASAASAQSSKKPTRPTQPIASAQQPQSPQADPPPVATAPRSPTGIGDIKIGTSRDSLLALPDTSPVRLAGGLNPAERGKDAPPLKPGQTYFEGKLVLPSQPTPLKATFTFMDDSLESLGIVFEAESRLFDQMIEDITSKYGPGKVNDSIKDEDCIYRNGNSFKIKSGLRVTEWEEVRSDGRALKTTFMDLQFAMCPSNLRDGMVGVKRKVMSIGVVDKPSAPKANLF